MVKELGQPRNGRVTNQEIYFMLGRLMADQQSTLDLLRTHMAQQDKRWEHIYAKTDKLGGIISWASGAAAATGSVVALIAHKVLGF